MYVIHNNLGKSGKDRGLKIDTDVVFYEEKNGRRKFMGSAIFSRAVLTYLDEFHHLLHSVDLSRVACSDLFVKKHCYFIRIAFLVRILMDYTALWWTKSPKH